MSTLDPHMEAMIREFNADPLPGDEPSWSRVAVRYLLAALDDARKALRVAHESLGEIADHLILDLDESEDVTNAVINAIDQLRDDSERLLLDEYDLAMTKIRNLLREAQISSVEFYQPDPDASPYEQALSAGGVALTTVERVSRLIKQRDEARAELDRVLKVQP